MRSVDKTPAREWQGSRAAGYAVNVNGVSAPSVPGSGGGVNPQIAALEWLAGQGARFALVEAGGKKPLGGGWQNTPHDLAAAMKHARRGGNIGLLCGQPSGGIVAIDVDRDYEPVVEALGPFANTVRVVRDNAPGRGKLLYRVPAPTPSQTWTPAGWEPAEGEKRSPWAELLSDGRHALVPPSTYDGGHYVLRGQEYGIADLNEEELAFVWYKITDGRPGLPEPAQEDNRGRDQGRDDDNQYADARRLVLEAWTTLDVFRHHGRADRVVEERGGELRLPGNGGLLIKSNGEGWYCFTDQVGGGDAVSAWAWCTGRKLPVTGREFWAVLEEMAQARGLELPKRQRRQPSAAPSQDGVQRRPSQATRLVRLASEKTVELWHTPDGEGFATVRLGEGLEHLPLKFRAFKNWLAQQALTTWGEDEGVPHASAMDDALTVLEGLALYEGSEYPHSVRVGGDLRAVYLDLCDPARHVVEITPDGWRVVTDVPVRFWRPPNALPLPQPARGGNFQELAQFLNVEPDDLPLVVGFLIGCLHPDAPYPVLALYGEQGAAKSTAARVLKSLVDPSTPPLRKTIRKEEDLAIAAKNGWLLAFDNLSGIPNWLSDALCGLATGLGFGTRRLFSNYEEALFDARRPIILNGIDELAVRGDLRDRMITLILPPIPDDRRRPEADFWREFEQARPRLLGALLDAVAMALRNFPHTRLERLPRMADFALWVHAAEPALDQPAGTFMDRYTGNRSDAHRVVLEADPVGRALLAWLEEDDDGFEWTGTASEMLALLNGRVPEEARPRKGWPGDATRLGGKLRRLAPALRGLGVDVDYIRHKNVRAWALRKSAPSPSPDDAASVIR